MVRVILACAWIAAAQPMGGYQFDAAGRPARIDQAWELLAGDEAIITLQGFARCGRDMFLSDGQFTVWRADADQPSQRLRRFAGEDRGIGAPYPLAADCARQRLYVVNNGPRTVVALDITTGAAAASRPYQREIYETRSLTILSPGMVQLGGLWNQDVKNILPRRQQTTFFESTSIGQRLSMDSGAVSAMLAPYESRCAAAGICVTADLDAIGDGASRGWIASIGIGTSVALYDSSGARSKTIDVRSPKFVRDGTEMPVETPASKYEPWRGRNSVIRRVFSFGKYFAVIHSRTIHGPDWVFGQQSQFEVYMNIFGADGAPLTSDVRLPDLPIGRDGTHLYAIDYGPQGRGQSPERVRLVRIPVAAGPAIVR
jgi:hypothetical protein